MVKSFIRASVPVSSIDLVLMTAEYINDHNSIYNYLLRYFLPELSDPHFQQEAAQEIEQDERMTYCRHMIAWLPYQPHFREIMKAIFSTVPSAATPCS